MGVGVLAAVMSTADSLIIAASQIFANDIYRRSMAKNHSDEKVDRNALVVSRIASVFVLLVSFAMAWQLRSTNIALIVWLGVGGMTAALTGPLILGALWSGVTRGAAIAGFLTGALVFIGISMYTLLIGGNDSSVHDWQIHLLNPFIRATIGGLASVFVTVAVSGMTAPLPIAHIRRLFPD